MLEWAWTAQTRHLVRGMLPFNGDETYVAGGILPRHTLNHGSAEATLLFIDAGDKLARRAEEQGLWTAETRQAAGRLVAEARAHYRENFWENGRLSTNNPRRAELAELPRFRHGVCERCQAEGRHFGIVWTERNETGRYLCPACLAAGPFSAAEVRRYTLQSVSLTPLYFGSDLFTHAELAPAVAEIVDSYRRTGRLPSRPDDAAGSAVGYDYGLLLYALTELGDPMAATLYERMLALLDPAGAWAEYYVDHRPVGTLLPSMGERH